MEVLTPSEIVEIENSNNILFWSKQEHKQADYRREIFGPLLKWTRLLKTLNINCKIELIHKFLDIDINNLLECKEEKLDTACIVYDNNTESILIPNYLRNIVIGVSLYRLRQGKVKVKIQSMKSIFKNMNAYATILENDSIEIIKDNDYYKCVEECYLVKMLQYKNKIEQVYKAHIEGDDSKLQYYHKFISTLEKSAQNFHNTVVEHTTVLNIYNTSKETLNSLYKQIISIKFETFTIDYMHKLIETSVNIFNYLQNT